MTDQLRPAFRLTADGNPFIGDRVLSIEITDEAGFESGQLIVTLDDADPQIARPRQGAVLAIAIGYRETGLVDFGSYAVEEIEREGWPRRLSHRIAAVRSFQHGPRAVARPAGGHDPERGC